MFCLSRGLGAPVGSMLAGTTEAMDRARLYRKRLGGGMRQAGVLAAAGLIALEQMSARLHEDHANAKFLAEELAQMPGLFVDLARVQTNIVIVDISGTGFGSAEFVGLMRERGLLFNAVTPATIRIVTHFDAPRAACEQALEVIGSVIKGAKKGAGVAG
jgi:threonine aldolase